MIIIFALDLETVQLILISQKFHVLNFVFLILGTSVCNGDSGGGLYFQKRNSNPTKPTWQLRGIVSNTVPKEGFVCDPLYYVIFTDVAKYLEWIKNNMHS